MNKLRYKPNNHTMIVIIFVNLQILDKNVIRKRLYRNQIKVPVRKQQHETEQSKVR